MRIAAALDSDTRRGPTDNGPYLVQGTATLLDADGRPYDASEPIALCRCGYSNTKPFCDGSHERANFAATTRAAARNSTPVCEQHT